MAKFESDSIDLHYVERGDGPAVMLLHGFGMTGRLCWDETGWLDLLASEGFRGIALDSRGHGLSSRPTGSDGYSADLMTRDVVHLLDHLGIFGAHLIGHSMGARTAFDVTLKHPDRVKSLIAVSVGSNLFQHVQAGALIRAIEGGDAADLPSALRQTALTLLAAGNSKEALAACLAAPRPVPTPEDLRSISQPVLVVCGDGDAIVGDPGAVAAALPDGRANVITGREHTDVLASPDLQEIGIAFLKSAVQRDGHRARP